MRNRSHPAVPPAARWVGSALPGLAVATLALLVAGRVGHAQPAALALFSFAVSARRGRL